MPPRAGPLRVLACGGRAFDDRTLLDQCLDRPHREHGVARLIAGAARGADTLAAEWARRHGVALSEFAAERERLGRAAGPIRNQRMLDEGRPDLVVAFPGGRGTRDMTRRAREAGVALWEPVAPEAGREEAT